MKMNNFVGDWTKSKIEILVKYAKAYLTIMNKYAKKYNWKLLYFDGFAGSGFIRQSNDEIVIGAAKRILAIEKPIFFDKYHFVEKETNNVKNLIEEVKNDYPSRNIKVINGDCNEEIRLLGEFLKSEKGKQYKVLAYIDPCGMQLNWRSLIALKESNVDAWVLVPTGMGVNRLLRKDGKISDSWIEKLEKFLGLSKQEIMNFFYKETDQLTLFEDETIVYKEEETIEKSAQLYQSRLGELFKFVTNPYILKNKHNSPMFHFYMVSNNETAVKIANDIIEKYNN